MIEQPWTRQSWETPTAHRAFLLYLEQDTPRSIDRAYRQYMGRTEDMKLTASGCWRKWAGGMDYKGDPISGSMTWIERAAAWDAHLSEIALESWAKRFAETREKEYARGQDLWELSEQILATAPDFIKRSESWQVDAEGERYKLVRESLDWSAMIRAIEVASKLQRLATNEVTNRVGQTSNSNVALAGNVTATLNGFVLGHVLENGGRVAEDGQVEYTYTDEEKQTILDVWEELYGNSETDGIDPSTMNE